MKRIITMVGTSIFTNRFENNTIRTKYKELEKEPYEHWEEQLDAGNIEELKTATKQALNRDQNDSAEIKSILAIANELKEDVDVYLLATDTVVSRLGCELVKEWFTENHKDKPSIDVKFNEQKDVVKGLQVEDSKVFKKDGLVKLVERFDQIIDENYFENCILNITGGYKVLIPYLTIFSQISKVPIYYIFEDTDQLIKVPQLPINIDWRFVSDYSVVFSDLYNTLLLENGKTWTDYKREHFKREHFVQQEEFEDYIQEEKDEHNNYLVGLNAIGRFLWKEYKNHFFVSIPHTCKYFKEEINGKKSIEVAIRELKRRLDELLEKSQGSFDKLSDTDVKHHCIDDTWVYKHSNPQIRLQYKYDQDRKNLIIYNYFFIKSQTDDNKYSEWLKKEYTTLKTTLKEESALTLLGLRKP